MLGQVISSWHYRYNLIVLAGGAGSRMGQSSDYIPKALTKLGERRAIDYILDRYKLIASNIIIGVSHHADLLMSYVKGNHNNNIKFSLEHPNDLRNNAVSAAYCLDHADSRLGTIITFCDLLMLGNWSVPLDCLYYVTDKTEGCTGTFRHSVIRTEIIKNDPPLKNNNGLLGTFVFSDTPLLKSIIYNNFHKLTDLTDDVVVEYSLKKEMTSLECDKVYEFGTEEDLNRVRKLWENA